DPVEQAGQLRPGDVLVARATDPGWTPLFLIASAAVIERGGMLSHAAIVAREVGIPVVAEVALATRTRRDGERVRVAGNTGLVEAVGESRGRAGSERRSAPTRASWRSDWAPCAASSASAFPPGPPFPSPGSSTLHRRAWGGFPLPRWPRACWRP